LTGLDGFDEGLDHGGDFAGLLEHRRGVFDNEDVEGGVSFLGDLELSAKFGAGAFGDSEKSDGVLVAIPFITFGDVGRNGKGAAGELAF
jgi:hypothetical protein